MQIYAKILYYNEMLLINFRIGFYHKFWKILRKLLQVLKIFDCSLLLLGAKKNYKKHIEY